MDVFRLKRTINDYRSNVMISSYPIAVKDEKNKIMIIWFTFDIPSGGNNQDVRIVANKAYCMDEEYNVRLADFKIEKTEAYEIYEEPELDYDKYMIKLGEIIEKDSVNEKAIRELLAASEQFYIADLAFKAAELFTE